MQNIRIQMHNCDTGVSYSATFTGPHAEDHALAYIDRKAATHHIHEPDDQAPLDAERFPRLLERLYPLCHHGMSLGLFMDPIGPHHFGTYEQEKADAMAFGW